MRGCSLYKDGLIPVDEDNQIQQLIEEVVLPAIKHLVYISRRNRITVEKKLKKFIPNKNQNRVSRSYERPIYINQTIREVKDIFGISIPTKNKKPHSRKSHEREYKHPRYVNVKGQIKKVAGSLIGAKNLSPSEVEKIIGNKKYRILLNNWV